MKLLLNYIPLKGLVKRNLKNFYQQYLMESKEDIVVDDKMLKVTYTGKGASPCKGFQVILERTLVGDTYQMVVEADFAKLACFSLIAIHT